MKNLTSVQEYQDAKNMLMAYDNASKEYCRTHKTNCIPSEVYNNFPFANLVDNDLRSAIETWEFIHDIPHSYFLYISEDKRKATTWTGQTLGNVSFGNSYRSNMGDTRIPIRVYAINGKTYSGTFYKSAGDYARIKLCKN